MPNNGQHKANWKSTDHLCPWSHIHGSYPRMLCVYDTISGPEERSKDSLLDCHQISWVTACLKFTAVNIPNRQLSVAWPVPIITTGLVHYVARENAKPCKVKWSAFCPLVILQVKHNECWWVERPSITVWKRIKWQINVCRIGSSGIWFKNVFSTGLRKSMLKNV